MVLYICKKCNKNFNRKQCYDVHINRKFPCSYEEINDQKTDNNKILELEQKILILESENKRINELYNNLLDKCFKNSKTIKTNNNTTTNNNNTINNINNINVNLVPFGMENIDDLTPEEKKTILNAGMFCSVMCAKKLNCNPRLPQYQNIAFTNLRSNDAKIYDKDKTWKTVDKEDLFETVIPRRIDDVNALIENEEIKISPYMDNLVKKGTDEDGSTAHTVLLSLQEQGRSCKKY